MSAFSMSAERHLATHDPYHPTRLRADPELTAIAEAFRQAQGRPKVRNQ